MKGQARIILRDIKTGAEEEYLEDNLVTKAVEDLFSTNISGMLYKARVDFFNSNFPLATKAIGGILAFEDKLEENVEKYYAPSSNNIVAFASNDSSDSVSTKRGSFNQVESGKIDNGYKFVWDFTSSQGNGTISSLALTHYLGGKSYMGDEYKNDNFLVVSTTERDTKSLVEKLLAVSAVEIDFEKGEFTSLVLKDTGEILIRKFKKDLINIGLTDDLLEKIEITNEQTVMPEKFKQNNYNNFFYSNQTHYIGLATKSEYTNTSITIIKIKKDDLSFKEEVWDFTDIKFRGPGVTSKENSGSYVAYQYSAYRDNYIYLLEAQKKGLYKINLDNKADVKYIEYQIETDYIHMINDWIIGDNFILNTKDEVIPKRKIQSIENRSRIFTYGPYLYYFYADNRSSINKRISVLTPYLATINNLASPIIKTADKTMKIIYTLREET